MSNKDISIGKVRLQGAIGALLMFVVVNAICTQFIANRMIYDPVLGNPLFARVYNPFNWWEWFKNFYPYAPDTYRYAVVIFVIGFTATILLAKLFIGIRGRSSRKHEGIHGTAHFATQKEVEATGLIGSGDGVYCGGFDDDSGRTQYLRHKGQEHICVFAPTGSGKGVGLVIPTLLSYLQSVFVVDIKGENYAITSGWRQKHANNIVLKFDPAASEGSCSWNPLGEIGFGTFSQISDAQNIAHMIIDSDGKGLNDHWRRAAFELLSGVIMHALYKAESVGRTPCIKDCADMLTGTGDFAAPEIPPSDYEEPKVLAGLFEEMKSVSFPEGDPAAKEAEFYIRSVGTGMGDKPGKELGSIVSTASMELSLYRDPTIAKNTSRSDFKVVDMMDHEKPVSLYFIATPDNLLRLRPLRRLLLARIIAGLTGEMEFSEGRSKTKHKHNLLLMLDEFPSLGKVDIFESSLAFIRGFGIKAYIICQDIQQLYQAYGQNQSITSNCHIRIAYAPTELKTAEMLSKMCGVTTVINEQISVSGKRFGGTASQFSSSYHSSSRPLMTPDEVQSLPLTRKDEDGNIVPGELLVFVAGHSVIRGRQILYFLDPTFSKRSKIAPPKISDVVRS
jgi:type IV secretion system protein VirD4